jgi:hypothetical protein
MSDKPEADFEYNPNTRSQMDGVLRVIKRVRARAIESDRLNHAYALERAYDEIAKFLGYMRLNDPRPCEEAERVAELESITPADKERTPEEEHQMAQSSAYYVLQTQGAAEVALVCRFTGLAEINAKRALEGLVECGKAVKIFAPTLIYCIANQNDRIPRFSARDDFDAT